MNDASMPALHPSLELVRYGKKHDGDRFVGFWLLLATQARRLLGRPDARQTRRSVEQFFASREMKRAIESAGLVAVHEQLLDAAAVYFGTCLTDSQYSTTMWRTNRLEPEKLRGKMAKDTADILGLLEDSGALHGAAQQLPAILTDALLRSLAPHGAEELSRAVAGNPSAARALGPEQED